MWSGDETNPQRLGYCSDFTAPEINLIFCIMTFRLQRELPDLDTKKIIVDDVEEEIEYHVNPCNGVKIFGAHEDGCEFMTSPASPLSTSSRAFTGSFTQGGSI